MIYLDGSACSEYKTKGEQAMLMVKNQDVYYKVLSCIFVVVLIVVMVVNRNIIDLIYLGLISIFILIYFIEIKRK